MTPTAGAVAAVNHDVGTEVEVPTAVFGPVTPPDVVVKNAWTAPVDGSHRRYRSTAEGDATPSAAEATTV